MKDNIKNRNKYNQLIVIVIIICSIIIASSTILKAYAFNSNRVSKLKSNTKCSLSILFNYIDDKGNIENISGYGVEAIKVASISEDGGAAYYKYTNDFSTYEKTLEGVSAIESSHIASDLSNIASSYNLHGANTISKDDGKASFTNLEIGMYLIRELSKDGKAREYSSIEPFLVSVPEVTNDPNDSWNYDVHATPKMRLYQNSSIVEVDPPVKKSIIGNPTKPGKFLFELEALDSSYPMPSGSIGNIKKITVQGPGKYEFGKWEYSEPGEYRYQITELQANESGYTYDKSKYILIHSVRLVDNNLVVDTTIEKDGEKVDLVEFTNKYSKYKEILDVIKTGDSPLTYILIAILVCAGLIVILLTRRSNHEQN